MTIAKIAFPTKPTSSVLAAAYDVLVSGVASTNSFVELYNQARSVKTSGRASDAEQDLLRAMVVMSGATLDSTLKRMISDGFHDALRKIPSVRGKAAELIQKQLEQGTTLGRVLFSEDLFSELGNMVIRELTGSSLQSVEEIYKVGHFLGLDISQIMTKDFKGEIKEAFDVRNQIIHELDVLPLKKGAKRGPGQGIRRPRAQDEMAKYSANLQLIAQAYLTLLDHALQ